MNFDFSDDQRSLQETVGRALKDRSTSQEVRRVLEGEQPFSRDTWDLLAGMGALGAAIPEEFGGSGLGYLELCLVAEEAGRNLAAAPLLSGIYLAAETILRAGSAAQKTAFLPAIAAGELIVTAWLGDNGQYVLADGPLQLTNGRLRGTLNAVPDAMIAGHAVLLVENSLVLVDLSAAGVRREAQKSIDPTRPLGRISFEATIVQPLGEAGAGAAIAARVVEGAAVLLAFEQLGGASAILMATRDYALERKAFGRVIGGYQAVGHKLADIYVAIELARAHAYYGAWALSSDAPELPRAAAAARITASTAYDLAAQEGMHLHGGIGYTWEMDCHLHMRRARWLGQILGSAHIWRARLADNLIEEAA